MSISVRRIYRYPVKGLSAEPLSRIALQPREGLPQDRRFALARAETRFDPENPEWLPKTQFVMLARDEKLALLQTRFDAADGSLTIRNNGSTLEQARIGDAGGRRRIEAFFAEFLSGDLTGPPRLVEAPGHTFTDASRKPGSTTYKYVSLLNLESIAALEKVLGTSVDPTRFRANIYFDGIPAWTELDWVGQELLLSDARLKIVSPTVRCAATTVNPATGERDLDIPRALKQAFGHIHMGVYAEVTEAGEIGEGAPGAIAR